MVKGSITPSVVPANYNISCSVTDGTDPLESVDVILEDNDENQYTGKTGSAGGCTISNVPEGTYTVIATKNGYNEYTGTITVNEETTTLNITLTEE